MTPKAKRTSDSDSIDDGVVSVIFASNPVTAYLYDADASTEKLADYCSGGPETAESVVGTWIVASGDSDSYELICYYYRFALSAEDEFEL